jgi:hypothetical protein
MLLSLHNDKLTFRISDFILRRTIIGEILNNDKHSFFQK